MYTPGTFYMKSALPWGSWKGFSQCTLFISSISIYLSEHNHLIQTPFEVRPVPSPGGSENKQLLLQFEAYNSQMDNDIRKNIYIFYFIVLINFQLNFVFLMFAVLLFCWMLLDEVTILQLAEVTFIEKLQFIPQNNL